MTELRLLDLREEVPEPPESLLALPDLHRRIRVRRGWRRSSALLAIVLATAGTIFAVTRIGPTSTPPLALAPHRDGLVVFAEYSPGPDKYLPNAALYAMTPAGTDVRRLTATSGRIDALTASLNGRKIAYDAETYQPSKDLHVTGDYVHVMNANGSDNRTVVSLSPVVLREPGLVAGRSAATDQRGYRARARWARHAAVQWRVLQRRRSAVGRNLVAGREAACV